MAEKRAGQMNFRPSQTARKRLEQAVELGFDKTEIINGMLENYFEQYVQEAAQKKLEHAQQHIQKLKKFIAEKR